MTKSEIMQQAWAQARAAAKKYGGRPIQYIWGGTLSEAWKAAKLTPDSVVVDPRDLPYLGYYTWSKDKVIYHNLEKGASDNPTSSSFLMVNWRPDDYDADVRKYKEWVNCDDYSSDEVCKMLSMSPENFFNDINGRKVRYIPYTEINGLTEGLGTGLFVYSDLYEQYKLQKKDKKELEDAFNSLTE